MKARLQAKAVAYLREILGVEAEFTPLPDLARLPLHITESYEIAKCTLMGKEFMALQVHHTGQTPAAMAKQAEWLHQKTGLRSLFILESVGGYDGSSVVKCSVT